MTNKQENKLSMYLSTESWLSTNLSKLNHLPHLAELHKEFQDMIQAIKDTRQTQEVSTKGAAKQKNLYKKSLLREAEIVLNILKAYASIHEQPRLSEEINYTPSQLQKAPDTVLGDISKLLYRKATEHLEALKPFLLTQENLDNLQKATDAYIQAIPNPRVDTVNRKSVTASLVDLFTQTDALLKNKIDMLLELIKPTDLNSYNAYRSARRMVNLGSRRRKSEERGVEDGV